MRTLTILGTILGIVGVVSVVLAETLPDTHGIDFRHVHEEPVKKPVCVYGITLIEYYQNGKLIQVVQPMKLGGGLTKVPVPIECKEEKI